MSWETSKRVWENVPPSVTKNERLALLALAGRADKYGVCWPGYDDIGRLVGVDPRSAMRLIEKLEKENQVIVLRQMGMRGGRGYTNLYFVITGLSAQGAKVIAQNHPILKESGWILINFVARSQGPMFPSLYPKDWQVIREVILNRDNGTCVYCGDAASHVDHIMPVIKGGLHTENNLVAACERCNKSKRDHDFLTWYLSQDFFSRTKPDYINSIFNEVL